MMMMMMMNKVNAIDRKPLAGFHDYWSSEMPQMMPLHWHDASA
jgi:hypothetical protein